MSSNSESRKRRTEASDLEDARRALHAFEAGCSLCAAERRREVTQAALEAVFSGADFIDADAFLDQLGDRGGRVEVDK